MSAAESRGGDAGKKNQQRFNSRRAAGSIIAATPPTTRSRASCRDALTPRKSSISPATTRRGASSPRHTAARFAHSQEQSTASPSTPRTIPRNLCRAPPRCVPFVAIYMYGGVSLFFAAFARRERVTVMGLPRMKLSSSIDFVFTASPQRLPPHRCSLCR